MAKSRHSNQVCVDGLATAPAAVVVSMVATEISA
jgi:hypothetical protein